MPFEKEGSQLLFQIISECYEKRSVMLTTNLEFSKWDGIFYDENLHQPLLIDMWEKAPIFISHLYILNFQFYRGNKKGKLVQIVSTLFFSGTICSLIDSIYWKGSIDYIRIINQITLDLKGISIPFILVNPNNDLRC
ncbi:MAG: ATP-binding protein [Thermotaleaceae bacterium]